VLTAIRRAGLERHVSVAGFASDLPAVMAALDVALYVPLESDGMSRVLFEYLAAGRPLVAARTGVVPEVLVDGVHALLVPAGDAGALADALARLLQAGARRARLGAAARAPALARLADGDVLFASKPRPTSFGVGLLARRRPRRPLILDIDDWELGFFYRGGFWGRVGRLLNLSNPNSLTWTWLAERLVSRA